MKAIRWTAALLILLVLCGCASRPSEKKPPAVGEKQIQPSAMPKETDAPEKTDAPDSTDAPERTTLIGPAGTEEEARELAELYGIEFITCSHGLALFGTEEDPRAVIERGRENGWPELSINYKRKPF